MLEIILKTIRTLDIDGINDGVSDGINKKTQSAIKLTKVDEKIIVLLKENCFITNEIMAEKLYKSIRTIERRMKYLKDNNIIDRLGSNKAGKWLVN